MHKAKARPPFLHVPTLQQARLEGGEELGVAQQTPAGGDLVAGPGAEHGLPRQALRTSHAQRQVVVPAADQAADQGFPPLRLQLLHGDWDAHLWDVGLKGRLGMGCTRVMRRGHEIHEHGLQSFMAGDCDRWWHALPSSCPPAAMHRKAFAPFALKPLLIPFPPFLSLLSFSPTHPGRAGR